MWEDFLKLLRQLLAKWWVLFGWFVLLELATFSLLGFQLEWWEKFLFAAFLAAVFLAGYLVGWVDGYNEADGEWKASLQRINDELRAELDHLVGLRAGVDRARNEAEYVSLLASIRSGAWRN